MALLGWQSFYLRTGVMPSLQRIQLPPKRVAPAAPVYTTSPGYNPSPRNALKVLSQQWFAAQASGNTALENRLHQEAVDIRQEYPGSGPARGYTAAQLGLPSSRVTTAPQRALPTAATTTAAPPARVEPAAPAPASRPVQVSQAAPVPRTYTPPAVVPMGSAYVRPAPAQPQPTTTQSLIARLRLPIGSAGGEPTLAAWERDRAQVLANVSQHQQEPQAGAGSGIPRNAKPINDQPASGLLETVLGTQARKQTGAPVIPGAAPPIPTQGPTAPGGVGRPAPTPPVPGPGILGPSPGGPGPTVDGPRIASPGEIVLGVPGNQAVLGTAKPNRPRKEPVPKTGGGSGLGGLVSGLGTGLGGGLGTAAAIGGGIALGGGTPEGRKLLHGLGQDLGQGVKALGTGIPWWLWLLIAGGVYVAYEHGKHAA